MASDSDEGVELEAESTTITATFSRTVQIRQYEPAQASTTITKEFGTNIEMPEAIAIQNDMFADAKSVVYEQLGINTAVEDGVVIEMVKDQFPGTTSEPSNVRDLTKPAPPPNPPHDPKSLDFRDPDHKPMLAENAEWVKERFAALPEEFYDNRGDKKSPRSPDIKHKRTGATGWVD